MTRGMEGRRDTVRNREIPAAERGAQVLAAGSRQDLDLFIGHLAQKSTATDKQLQRYSNFVPRTIGRLVSTGKSFAYPAFAGATGSVFYETLRPALEALQTSGSDIPEGAQSLLFFIPILMAMVPTALAVRRRQNMLDRAKAVSRISGSEEARNRLRGAIRGGRTAEEFESLRSEYSPAIIWKTLRAWAPRIVGVIAGAGFAKGGTAALTVFLASVAFSEKPDYKEITTNVVEKGVEQFQTAGNELLTLTNTKEYMDKLWELIPEMSPPKGNDM